MAYNYNLLKLSRLVLEKYVIDTLSKRPTVDHVEMSTYLEDVSLKIDGFVYTKNGLKVPVQVKTRTINSNNFSISPKDFRDDQSVRVFCFIDKTFDKQTVSDLLSMNEAAYDAVASEQPEIFMVTQQRLLSDLTKMKKMTSDNGDYYLISKSYLRNV